MTPQADRVTLGKSIITFSHTLLGVFHSSILYSSSLTLFESIVCFIKALQNTNTVLTVLGTRQLLESTSGYSEMS